VGYTRPSHANGAASDAFTNAFSERRRRTTSPVATMGVLCATHCMHIGLILRPASVHLQPSSRRVRQSAGLGVVGCALELDGHHGLVAHDPRVVTGPDAIHLAADDVGLYLDSRRTHRALGTDRRCPHVRNSALAHKPLIGSNEQGGRTGTQVTLSVQRAPFDMERCWCGALAADYTATFCPTNRATRPPNPGLIDARISASSSRT
jgi:hypothetical protein